MICLLKEVGKMMSEQRCDESSEVLNRIVEIVNGHPESAWEALIHEAVPKHLRQDLNIVYGIEAICGLKSSPSNNKLFPYQ